MRRLLTRLLDLWLYKPHLRGQWSVWEVEYYNPTLERNQIMTSVLARGWEEAVSVVLGALELLNNGLKRDVVLPIVGIRPL